MEEKSRPCSKFRVWHWTKYYVLFAPTSKNSDGNATTQSLKVSLFPGSRSGQNRGEVQSSFKVANIELLHCLTDHPSICMEKIFLWESGERTANSFTKIEEGDFSVSLSSSLERAGRGQMEKNGTTLSGSSWIARCDKEYWSANTQGVGGGEGGGRSK